MFNFSSQTIMDKIYWNWLLFYNISNFFQTIHPSAPPLPSTMLFTVCDCPQHCIGGRRGYVLRSNQHSSKYFVHDCLRWREKKLRFFSHDWSLISYFLKLFWVNASAGGWGECVSTNIYFASVNNNGNSGKYKKMIYKNASNITFLIKRFAGANRRDIKILLDKFLYWTVCGRKPSIYKNTVSM